MARPSRPWFRFYVEALSDRKLRRLDPSVRWVWVGVLGLARMSPRPGVLMIAEAQPADEHDVADVAGVTLRLARQALSAFEQAGMVERHDDVWHVTNWASRQFESDLVTERTRKHRSKERSKERSNAVSGNTPETETETETDATTPQPPAQRGASDATHDGQHPNCRRCGTNRRGTPPAPPASPTSRLPRAADLVPPPLTDEERAAADQAKTEALAAIPLLRPQRETA